MAMQAQTQMGISWLYAGDLWDSAADKLKSHDLQYWSPLQFNDSVTPPAILPLKWQDRFALNLTAVRADGPW